MHHDDLDERSWQPATPFAPTKVVVVGALVYVTMLMGVMFRYETLQIAVVITSTLLVGEITFSMARDGLRKQ